MRQAKSHSTWHLLRESVYLPVIEMLYPAAQAPLKKGLDNIYEYTLTCTRAILCLGSLVTP